MSVDKARGNLEKAKEFYIDELSKVRGNRPNPQIIEDIQVEAYGAIMPIKQLGTVSVADPTLITIQCWDKANADSIKKGVEKAELNLNPSVDGDIIRIPIPPLSQERREELVRVVRKLSEEVKVSARHIRREAIDELETESLSEDEIERGKKEVQRLVDEFNEFVDKEVEKKEKELLTI